MCMLRFFFFKQKTAYEMLRSLVGSEMCIRDSLGGGGGAQNMVLELGKQNLTSFVKQGEQGFLTTYVPFVRNLRHYFKVDNNYVRTKMQLLFFPFRHPKYLSLIHI
eukprot:TRINITY_DN39258_c0_g1_i1.p1 TRINITY_DN39258_c0_g1~~TRINITY_DN39258_c0_g1_i1.p1  ORF type:complete len:106 (-),score=41.84 TRINITY_DN39258_c0_g1_i1:96-413(-)